MKYRIRFSGCPKGRLNTAVKDVVTKVVAVNKPRIVGTLDRPRVAVIEYLHVGNVERWVSFRRGYVWKPAYSENGNVYPWLTKTEARKDAEARGAKARFIE